MSNTCDYITLPQFYCKTDKQGQRNGGNFRSGDAALCQRFIDCIIPIISLLAHRKLPFVQTTSTTLQSAFVFIGNGSLSKHKACNANVFRLTIFLLDYENTPEQSFRTKQKGNRDCDSGTTTTTNSKTFRKDEYLSWRKSYIASGIRQLERD